MLDKEFTFDRQNVTLALKCVASKYPGPQVHMLTGIVITVYSLLNAPGGVTFCKGGAFNRDQLLTKCCFQ